MDYSAANTSLWSWVIQVAIICVMILAANFIRRKVPFIRKSLMPTAVLAGFILLILNSLHIININTDFMEMLTYHGIGIGFVALGLRVPTPLSVSDKKNLIGLKSGALIASTYSLQGVIGLLISLVLSYTIRPDMFQAAGILLPMGYGQGPGQANNIGTTYENLGMAGGQSFGMALAAAGFLCACIIGVIYLNYLRRKGRINREQYEEISGSVTIDTFQTHDEIPISESVDRFSMNLALIAAVYGLTFLVSKGLTSLLAITGLGGLAKTLTTLIWGFNFLIGALLAILTRVLIKLLRKKNFITRQYQNNYLLSRCSGAAFDLMVVAGIATISFDKLSGLWLPFCLMAVIGGIVTFFYLLFITKRIYPDYHYAGFLSMFGMMTGTISSGVLLLREVDQNFDTPAANNLLIGSGFAIMLGAPILGVVAIAPNSPAMCWGTLGLLVVYFAILLLIMLKAKRKNHIK